MRLLVIEDEKALAKAIGTILERNQYEVDVVYDGQSALDYLDGNNYDGVILDIMLPEEDGITVLKTIREAKNDIPVLLLTAKSMVDDKVEGLDAGANDYLTKPFDMKELLARIRAMLRVLSVQNTSVYTFGNICLDQKTFELSGPQGRYRLASKEYQTLQLMLKQPRILIPTERFMEKIWCYDSEADISVVWVYISHLRKKLSAIGANVTIKASRNAGYSVEKLDD